MRNKKKCFTVIVKKAIFQFSTNKEKVSTIMKRNLNNLSTLSCFKILKRKKKKKKTVKCSQKGIKHKYAKEEKKNLKKPHTTISREKNSSNNTTITTTKAHNISRCSTTRIPQMLMPSECTSRWRKNSTRYKALGY